MQEKDLFEYAVIRVVPKVEREEFLNVGVILYCAKQKFLQIKCSIDEERLSAFCKLVKAMLQFGGKNSTPYDQPPLPSRERVGERGWLRFGATMERHAPPLP